MRQQRVFHLACRFLIAFYRMLFPTNQLKIIDFKGKIIEILVFARVHAIWTSMIKSLSFWRLRGGSGRLRGGSGEAPGGFVEAPGRFREAPGDAKRSQNALEGSGSVRGLAWGVAGGAGHFCTPPFPPPPGNNFSDSGCPGGREGRGKPRVALTRQRPLTGSADSRQQISKKTRGARAPRLIPIF